MQTPAFGAEIGALVVQFVVVGGGAILQIVIGRIKNKMLACQPPQSGRSAMTASPQAVSRAPAMTLVWTQPWPIRPSSTMMKLGMR
jgi:hypothetical protein